jgi:hypothetical protein
VVCRLLAVVGGGGDVPDVWDLLMDVVKCSNEFFPAPNCPIKVLVEVCVLYYEDKRGPVWQERVVETAGHDARKWMLVFPNIFSSDIPLGVLKCRFIPYNW